MHGCRSSSIGYPVSIQNEEELSVTIFCHLRAFVFVERGCSYCTYSRRLDRMLDDWNREQAAMPSYANCQRWGCYR